MKYTTGILYLLLLLKSSLCDIPVHCLKSQIQGQWKIFTSNPTELPNLYQFTCGHSMPSHERDAYTHTKIIPQFIFSINLKHNDEAILSFDNSNEKTGNWTMVYNEGFDILIDDYSFFAFSKYAFNDNSKSDVTSRWVSKCYSTLVGWYHKGNKYGCFYAEKSGVNADEITNGEPGNKLLVVENTVQTISNRVETTNDHFSSTTMISKQETLGNEISDDETFFLESKVTTKLKLSSEFKNHEEVVKRLNSMGNLWKATNYHEFEGMTIGELNKFAGRSKKINNNTSILEEFRLKSLSKNIKSHKVKKDLSLLKKLSNYHLNHKKTFLKQNKKDTQTDSKYQDMPKEHREWIKYMSDSRNQGSCGSCYAVATIGMLEARLQKQYQGKFNDKLSVQHILSCSVYNQGCDGGYAYLALKFGSEVEIFPESCMPYKVYINIKKRSTGSCYDRCDRSTLKQVYKISNYKYIGGSYGKCSEYEMMKEVLENGPIVVSFEPDYLFMHYKSGIYHSVGNTWLTRGERKPIWTKVDHSVVLVGWGLDEETQTKYWILQNSWGANWGDNGFFKMIRGIDHLGIESICESGIPYAVTIN